MVEQKTDIFISFEGKTKKAKLKFMNKLQKAFVFLRVRINLYSVCFGDIRWKKNER